MMRSRKEQRAGPVGRPDAQVARCMERDSGGIAAALRESGSAVVVAADDAGIPKSRGGNRAAEPVAPAATAERQLPLRALRLRAPRRA
jgi:hypothetical protein